jgi:hypothetical protein
VRMQYGDHTRIAVHKLVCVCVCVCVCVWMSGRSTYALTASTRARLNASFFAPWANLARSSFASHFTTRELLTHPYLGPGVYDRCVGVNGRE